MAETRVADVDAGGRRPGERAEGPRGGRQAVVVIHGIGDQRPMDTIRSFVRSVRGEDDTLYAVPDVTDTSFELHTLVASAGGGRPRTDYYEGYWAPEVRGTRLAHVLTWGRRLLLRSPRRLPTRVRRLALRVAFWLLVTVGLLVWLGSDVVALVTDRDDSWLPAVAKLVAAAVTTTIAGWLTDSLGDAARYLDSRPRNIALRTAIRSRVVRLLRDLHDSDQYERIVVVGHSLGGVVAYDAVRLLWRERLGGVDGDVSVDDTEVASASQELLAAERSGDQARVEAAREAFRAAQASVFAAMAASEPGRWRITDLVTLGAPLAHAAWLLAADGDDLAVRVGERELPTCPPQPSGPDTPSFLYGDDQRRFHHGAVFALTRWTNMWFPGDPVGGPVRGVGELGAGPLDRDAGLGVGVADIPLPGPRGLLRGLASHSTYWTAAAGRDELRTVLDAVTVDLP